MEIFVVMLDNTVVYIGLRLDLYTLTDLYINRQCVYM